MNVTATLDGDVVTIVDVDINGSDIYIAYVDSSNDVKVTKKLYPLGSTGFIIATSATVN